MTVKRIRLGGFTSWPIQSGEDRVFKTGEAAIDTETGVIKVGNGEDPFSELPESGGGIGSVAWADITGKPAVIGAGATQAAARSAIGAGTSSLALGTTSSTAKVGDYQPSWAQVTGKPAVIAAGADQAAARAAIGAAPSGAYVTVVEVPASADASGAAGQIAYDAQYLYACVAPDTWVRAALETWE